MKKLFMLIAIIAIGNIAMAQCNPSFTYISNFSGTGTSIYDVTFTNTTAFTPNDSEVVTYSYDFGDGSADYGASEHIYTSPGIYTVTLTMNVYYNDSLGLGNNVSICSNTYSQPITIADPCATAVTTTVSNITSAGATLNVVANTPAGSNGMTYAWDFGDGGTGSGASTSHTYTTSNDYTATLTATNGTCTFTNFIPQTVMILDCDTLSANFSYTASYNTANFNNTSTFLNMPVGYNTGSVSWDYGDGSVGYTNDYSHTYAAAGTYNVTLNSTWEIDSTSPYATTCTHSITLPVTVGNPPNRIAGQVFFPVQTDSIISNIKIWLVKLDTTTITAIDSVISNGDNNGTPYQFNNEPDGVYMVKAALTNNPTTPGSIGIVPTYDSASLYWSGAASINHAGSDDENNNIYMQMDTVTSGPGFVAGDVLTGAGKGTGAGEPVAGLLIYLRNTTTGKVVAFQYTDASGNYSFSNIPLGSYDTYPEGTGYATTPYDFAITSSQTNMNNIDFRENASTMTITPITNGINNINANAIRLNIYPNPTDGQVAIQYFDASTQAAHIDITNVLGQKMYGAALNFNNGNGIIKLNLSALPDGLYMVSIKSDNDINYTNKLTMQH